MSSNNKKILVFGGTGFIGESLIKELIKSEYSPIVITHNKKGELRDVEYVKADVSKPQSYESVFKDNKIHSVIYLIGIIKETNKTSFKDAHYNWPKDVLAKAIQHKASSFLYLSADGVEDQLTEYQTYKLLFEKQLEKADIEYKIFRPPVVLGDSDSYNFVNVIKKLFLFRIIPVFGSGNFSFSYIGRTSLTRSIVDSLVDSKSGIYTPDGVKTTYTNFLKQMSSILDRSVLLVPLPIVFFKLLTKTFEKIPGFPLSPDQLKMLLGKG